MKAPKIPTGHDMDFVGDIKFVKGEIKKGNTVKVWGDRLYIWDVKDEMAYSTRHFYPDELAYLKKKLRLGKFPASRFHGGSYGGK